MGGSTGTGVGGAGGGKEIVFPVFVLALVGNGGGNPAGTFGVT